jgi:hypothetical protein
MTPRQEKGDPSKYYDTKDSTMVLLITGVELGVGLGTVGVEALGDSQRRSTWRARVKR